MAPPQTDIDLYTDNTPNGHKVTIAFAELGLNHNVHHVDISTNEQKKDWFLKINPNGRIPGMVDNTQGKDSHRVFEGGAILLYLTANYDSDHTISFPYNTPQYWETVEWIIWLQSGIGPMQGQANHFFRYAPEKIEYGINRYQTETKRLYGVLDARLAAQREAGQGLWVVGGKFTIADIACFSWINWAEWAGVTAEPFPAVNEWLKTVNERPGVQKGLNTPSEFGPLRERMLDKKKADEYAKHHSGWIMKGQAADQEKHQ